MAKARSEIDARILTMQILAASIAAGALIFLVLAVVLHAAKPPDSNEARPVLSYLALAVAAVILVIHRIIPALIIKAGRRKIVREPSDFPDGDVTRLCVLFRTKMLASLGLLEGGAFLQLVAYLVEGFTPTLIATGILIAAMLILFPSGTHIESWLGEQMSQVNLERAVTS